MAFQIANSRKAKKGEPEINPLNTVDELITWKRPGCCVEAILLSVTEVMPRSNKVMLKGGASPTYKTLVCHDHDNGYLDDRFCNGTDNREAYMFYHWYGLDMFIYFSHHFITIPPCGWVAAGHLHGVQVLGTLITEWDEGIAMWKEILSSPTMTKTVINKLVAITDAYKFDGWLVNVENKLPTGLIRMLILFVEQLTKEIHSLNPAHKVIWYDAVTIEGHLQWQDELNSKNKPFFDVCDGIFLNYAWDPKALVASAILAGPRKDDVYAGIDVYGRASKSGGGYNTHRALEYIREADLSAAIFAPGWTFNHFGTESNFHASNTLWNSFKPYLLYHGFKELPFKTSFCHGSGRKYYVDGVAENEEPWHNLMRQQPQPMWEEFHDTVVSFRTESAFNGGSTMNFWNSINNTFRLMLCGFELNKLVEIKVTYKLFGSFSKFVVCLETSQLRMMHLFCEATDIDSEELEGHKKYLKSKVNTKVGEWTVSTFTFDCTETVDLVTCIYLYIGGIGIVSLGEIEIS